MSLRALLVCVLAVLLGSVACATLTPVDQAQLAGDAAEIAKCQAEGRACEADGGPHCFRVYDACMKDGGLR